MFCWYSSTKFQIKWFVFWHQWHLISNTSPRINLQNKYISGHTGCSAKMYPSFVLFISPVKIEIFQVCLFHIIGNFVFHPIFFYEYLLNYECTVRSWMNRGKLCLYQGIIEMTLLIFFLFPVLQTRKPNSNNKTENEL